MIDVEAAATHLGYGSPPQGYDPVAVARALGSANAQIGPKLIIAKPDLTLEQEAALDLAVLRVVSELWAWMSTPTGQVTMADETTVPAPVLRDAYYAVAPLLRGSGLVEWAVLA
jgi:hypothetical protein